MTVPTESDWGDYQSDLDAKCAHDLFGGRTNEEMQAHFRLNPIERTSELRFMPTVPFRYYVLGFRDFIMRKEFDFLSASDAASCFLSLVLDKLERQPQDIIPVMPDLLPALKYVAENQTEFDAEESIYGDFRETLRKIQSLNAAHGARE